MKDPTLRTDVTSAIDAIRTKGFGKGHPELINILWPTGTMARSDLEGLTALRTQLPEALKEFPELVKTSREQQQGDSKKKSSAPASSTVDFNALPKLEDIKEELKNALRSTPKGLETPNYSVVRTIDGELKLGIPEKVSKSEPTENSFDLMSRPCHLRKIWKLVPCMHSCSISCCFLPIVVYQQVFVTPQLNP